MIPRCATFSVSMTGTILPGCPKLPTTACARTPATVAACEGGDELLLDC